MIAAVESFLGQSGPWSLVVVFVVIVLESAAGLGLIFPGEAMAVIAGAMAADNFYSPWTAFAVVAIAAMIGDLTGYTLGHTKGQAVLARWAFDDLGLHRLGLLHSTRNAGSCRVAQRGLYVAEGTLREQALHADGWHDMHVHARLATDRRPQAR